MKLKDPKANKIIADRAVAYLKNRMMLNQQIIAMKFSEKELISFDDFMKRYNFLQAKIREVKDSGSPEKRKWIDASSEFVRVYADAITLTEKQIDELMSLIKKSIETYGLCKIASSSNETFFIRGVLSEFEDEIEDGLGKNVSEDVDYQELKNWKSYACLSDHVGFCDVLSGRIENDYGHAFAIYTHGRGVLCEVDKNGNVVKDRSLEEEDILLLPNLYMGNLYIDGDEIFTVFLEKFIDGKRFMKAVTYDQQLYPVKCDGTGEEDYAVPVASLHTLLSIKGLNFLEKVVYDDHSFSRMIKAYNKSADFTDIERKQIDTIVEIATNWWARAVCHPTFNNGDTSDVGVMLTMAANINNARKTMPHEETLNQFKSYLANEIKKELLCSARTLILSVDHKPGRVLLEAARQARLDANFPWKTRMNISRDKVSVYRYGTPEEVLYDAKALEESMGDDTPNGPKF